MGSESENLSSALALRDSTRMLHEVSSTTRMLRPPRPDLPVSARATTSDKEDTEASPCADLPSNASSTPPSSPPETSDRPPTVLPTTTETWFDRVQHLTAEVDEQQIVFLVAFVAGVVLFVTVWTRANRTERVSRGSPRGSRSSERTDAVVDSLLSFRGRF